MVESMVIANFDPLAVGSDPLARPPLLIRLCSCYDTLKLLEDIASRLFVGLSHRGSATPDFMRLRECLDPMLEGAMIRVVLLH